MDAIDRHLIAAYALIPVLTKCQGKCDHGAGCGQ